MILNNFQARAIRNAMQSLNEVGGVLKVSFYPAFEGEREIKVKECEDFGYIKIIVGFETVETYDDQQDFAESYGLI